MGHRVGQRAAARSGRRGKRDGFVAEPPLALIVAATALGMLVGALLAPAPADEGVHSASLSEAVGGLPD